MDSLKFALREIADAVLAVALGAVAMFCVGGVVFLILVLVVLTFS